VRARMGSPERNAGMPFAAPGPRGIFRDECSFARRGRMRRYRLYVEQSVYRDRVGERRNVDLAVGHSGSGEFCKSSQAVRAAGHVAVPEFASDVRSIEGMQRSGHSHQAHT
jgi:hypothetical protein